MEKLMAKCNNYFERSIEEGDYTIFEGGLEVKGDYITGQYVRVMDSLLNDGVYKIKSVNNSTDSKSIVLDGDTTDESFTGRIIGLAVPKSFIELYNKVNDFDLKAQKHAGVTSESIPNYSVGYDTANKDGATYYASEVMRFKRPPMPKGYYISRIQKRYD